MIRPGAVVLVSPGGCLFRTKAKNAQRAGAAGLLIVDPARGQEVSTATLVTPSVRIPVMVLGRAAARGLRPGGRAAMNVEVTTARRVGTSVVAESRGSGSGVVMAGGHLDSVPAGPGINDNGSGVAALLALAESTGRSAPGASIRLAFWGAEELGLYGSRRYVAALTPSERERIHAYVNLDMVGSPNAVRAVYAARDSGQRRQPRAQRLESLLNSLVKPTQHSAGASDHLPFARAGIPVGGVFTGASESGPGGRPRDACYHLACDRLANVDIPLVVRLARATRRAMLVLSRQAK
jgi:Iap family predicted aminopeptidase